MRAVTENDLRDAWNRHHESHGGKREDYFGPVYLAKEFSAAVVGITGRRIYGEIQGIRAKDTYPDEEVKAHLIDKSFPKSAEDMTLKLSNVTAAFYGLMLKV